MASKKVSIRVSNTFRGSVDRHGEFVREEDRNGRWIASNNLRIISDTSASLPAVLTAKRITSLVKQKPALQVTEGTDYQLTNKVDLDGDTERGLNPATAWYFAPQSPPVTLDIG